MSGEDVITVRGLFKDRVSNFLRKRIRVLDNLDLTVRRGETYGLLGPNGAGKTTTIKILLGLLRPDRGEINLLGAKPGDHTILKKIGFLPENPYFYSYLTAHEFLDFASQLFGLDRGKSKEHNLELLKRVGLAEEWADRPMHQYSKGMLQRLGIAQSLVNDPEILFLDEPMSGLDPIGRKDVREILSTLKEEGKTIFFNSHLLPDVNEICDRIGIMHQGRLVAEESIANISRGESYKALEDFFLAKVEGKKEGSDSDD